MKLLMQNCGTGEENKQSISEIVTMRGKTLFSVKTTAYLYLTIAVEAGIVWNRQ